MPRRDEVGLGFSYNPALVTQQEAQQQAYIQQSQSQLAPTRTSGGAERTGGVTQQYGVLSWEKELPSVIYGPEVKVSTIPGAPGMRVYEPVVAEAPKRMWRESPGYSPYQTEVEKTFLAHEAWIQSTPEGRLAKAIGATEYLGLYIAPMAKGYFASGLISTGISEGYSRFTRGVDISFDEATRSFAFGAASSFALTQGLKGVSWVAKTVAPEETAALTRAVHFGRPAQFLRRTKLAFMERVPIWKITQPFTKRIAVGEMAIPTFERYGLSELGLEDVAWKSMLTPRMGGVMFTRQMGEEIFKKGLSFSPRVLGGWYVREATFTPLVSQSQLTRMGIQPYIPRVTGGFLGKQGSLSTLLGVPTITLTQPQRLQREKTYPFFPTFTFQREKFRPQQLLEPQPKQRERQTPLIIPGISEIIGQPPIQKQPPWQAPKQPPLQTPSIPELFMPPRTVAPPTFKAPIWPLGGSDSAGRGGERGLFGKWFKKPQRIKTPKQMLETFFGSKSRARRKRK